MKHRHIHWWEHAKSFFTDVTLVKGHSAHNNGMELLLKSGRICLTTPNAIYSYEDLYNSFRTALEHIPSELKKAENALILGFGMGSIAWMIRNLHHSNIPITGVEIDPWIIEQFRHFYEYEGIDLVQVDAREFLESCDQTYDLVFIDIFKDELIPEPFQQAAFFYQVAQVTTKGGKVVYNKLARQGEQFGPDSPLARSFSKVFPQNRMVPARANRMLIGRK